MTPAISVPIAAVLTLYLLRTTPEWNLNGVRQTLERRVREKEERKRRRDES